MNPILRIEHLTKVYPNGVQALTDVSFDVPRGQFVAVIGLSGSGKSTLLRCINRLVEPTSGKVIFDGVDVTACNDAALRRVRRRIGMIFQHFNLVNRSPVVTNVLAGRLGYVNPVWSLINRFSPADMAKARAQLERVGLADKAGRLGPLGVPVFVFQEGSEPGAQRGFKEIARLSKGAWFRFDRAAAAMLAKLLSSVAVFAAGGRAALEARDRPEDRLMLEHLGGHMGGQGGGQGDGKR